MNLLYDLGMNELPSFRNSSIQSLCGLLPSLRDTRSKLPYDRAVYPEYSVRGQVVGRMAVVTRYERWTFTEMHGREVMRSFLPYGDHMLSLYAAYRIPFRTSMDLKPVGLSDHVFTYLFGCIDFYHQGMDSTQAVVDDVLQTDDMMQTFEAFCRHVFTGRKA